MFKQQAIRFLLQKTIKKHTAFTYNNTILTRAQSTSNYLTTKCEGFEVESKNQILWLKFNRPQKFNAITRDMYSFISDTFEQINSDDSHKAIVLTGVGDYYSSGNDLSNLVYALKHKDGPRAGMTESSEILRRFVDSFINLEKLLVVGVNGPAIGIAVTTMPLCDYIIASDKATFQTPFTALGQSPEACSSLTFPQIMGPSRSSELLLLNKKWDAQKAKDYGLVSEVVPHDKFDEHLNHLLSGIVKSCYPKSLKVSKSLIANSTKQMRMEVNRKECKEILELWLGEEFNKAIKDFFERSKKK